MSSKGGVRLADLAQCQIVSMLEFLQENLSTGTCPATLLGYLWPPYQLAMP